MKKKIKEMEYFPIEEKAPSKWAVGYLLVAILLLACVILFVV